MKARSRIFAAVLALAMVFTYMPAMAFADGGTTDLEALKTAMDAAKTDYDNAVTAAETALSEKTAAENSKTALEGELDSLTTELNTKRSQRSGLEGEVQAAQTNVQQKTTQWENDKANAASNEAAAQDAYDNAGRNFINEKINSIGGTDLEAMLAACKTYTTPLYHNNISTGPDGTQYTTIGQIANLDSFDQLISDACSYENLKQDIAYMREANELRALPAHNAGALKVSYQLMGTAIISNTMSVYAMGHNLTGNGWTFWNSGNSMTMGENLAFSGATPKQGWDPYHGWYFEERAVWLKDPEGKTPVTATEVNQVLEESQDESLSHHYTLPTIFYRTVDELVEKINKNLKIGHYTSLIDPEFKATGVAYVDGGKYGFKNYQSYSMPCVAAQEFNDDTSTSVSIDVFEQELDNYFTTYENNLNEAKAAVAALADEPADLASAKEELTSKQSELTALNNRITELEDTLIPAKQNELDDAEDVVETKTTAYNNALNDKTAKETAYNNAKDAFFTAHREANAHTWDAGKEEAGEITYTCTVCGETKTEPVEIPAKTSIESAAVSGIANKTYTGKVLAQNPVVKLSGTVLKAGTDYTLSYKNNKNVGLATVTITGKGSYEGKISKTFRINPKGTTLAKQTPVKKGFTAKWNKQAVQTTGYEVQIALNNKFTSGTKLYNITRNTIVTKKITKLKAKKNYYVRIRTYKTVSGKKYYSAWSKAKIVKTK